MDKVPIKDTCFEEPLIEKLRVQGSRGCGDNEWHTPQLLIDAAKEVMGDIDVDPASNEIANKVVQAKVYYTEDTNGLDKPWLGRVWMNPPYGRNLISLFVNTFCNKFKEGEITEGIVLVNNATETLWFRQLVRHCAVMLTIKGRISFWKEKERAGKKPLQGQVVFYFGKKKDLFINTFSSFGYCFLPVILK